MKFSCLHLEETSPYAHKGLHLASFSTDWQELEEARVSHVIFFSFQLSIPLFTNLILKPCSLQWGRCIPRRPARQLPTRQRLHLGWRVTGQTKWKTHSQLFLTSLLTRGQKHWHLLLTLLPEKLQPRQSPWFHLLFYLHMCKMENKTKQKKTCHLPDWNRASRWAWQHLDSAKETRQGLQCSPFSVGERECTASLQLLQKEFQVKCGSRCPHRKKPQVFITRIIHLYHLMTLGGRVGGVGEGEISILQKQYRLLRCILHANWG